MAKMCLCSNVSKKVERNVRVVILILAVGYIVEVRTAFVFHTAQGHIRPSQSRDGILEQHFYSRFLGINMGLLRLEFLSGILPSFFFSLRCYSRVDSICEFFASIFRTQSTVQFSLKFAIRKTTNSREQTTRFFCQMMSRNSISGPLRPHKGPLCIQARAYSTYT